MMYDRLRQERTGHRTYYRNTDRTAVATHNMVKVKTFCPFEQIELCADSFVGWCSQVYYFCVYASEHARAHVVYHVFMICVQGDDVSPGDELLQAGAPQLLVLHEVLLPRQDLCRPALSGIYYTHKSRDSLHVGDVTDYPSDYQ